MSPLLLAWAPYDVKGGKVRPQPFYKMASMWNVGRIIYQRLDTGTI